MELDKLNSYSESYAIVNSAIPENNTKLKKWDQIKDTLKNIPIPRDSTKFPQVKIVLLILAFQRISLYSFSYFLENRDSTKILDSTCSGTKIFNGLVESSVYFLLSFLLAPIPGLLADWKLGRSRVLSFGLLSCFLANTIVGIIFTIEILPEYFNCTPFVIFYYGSYTLAIIGHACFNAVIIPYGVDQMKEGSVITTLPSYFFWCYFFINMGAFFAFGEYTTYENKDSDRWLLVGNLYVSIFGSLCACLLFKISLMYGWFLPVPPQGSPVGMILGVFKNAIKTRLVNSKSIDIYNKMKWIEYAKRENQGRFSYEQVEDVKTFFRLFLVLIALVWYFSETSSFLVAYRFQTSGFIYHTDNRIPAYVSKIIWIAGMLIVIALELTPPGRWLIKKIPKIIYRMWIGLPFITISITFALVLELIHKAPCYSNLSTNSTEIILLSQDSFYLVYLQVPQYVFSAISEIIILASANEFVYAQSPEYMRSFIYSLLICGIGVGSLISAGILEILDAATCDDYLSIRNGCSRCLLYESICLEERYCYSAYYTYVIVLILSIIHLFLFLVVAYWYTPRRRHKSVGFHGLSVPFIHHEY